MLFICMIILTFSFKNNPLLFLFILAIYLITNFFILIIRILRLSLIMTFLFHLNFLLNYLFRYLLATTFHNFSSFSLNLNMLFTMVIISIIFIFTSSKRYLLLLKLSFNLFWFLTLSLSFCQIFLYTNLSWLKTFI